jgi:dihydroflavonol-4-reductase
MSTTVVVTGATGFLASHIIKRLLAQNFIVHGTVRSLANKSKYNFLQQFPNASTNLKLFEADLLQDGSFDEVVKNASIVLHTASPYFLENVKDAQTQLVEPALHGTLNVLQSALKAKQVRRVVLTSSTAAICAPGEAKPEKVFTEDDWNEVSSTTRFPYPFSKVQAEKAAWNFVKENNAHFDLVVLNPPLILGPNLAGASQETLNTSNNRLLDMLRKLKKGETITNTAGLGMVSVHDIAELHIRAGTSTDARVPNKRFIIATGSYSFLELARVAINEFPDEFKEENLKYVGTEEEAKANTPLLDTSRVHQVFPDLHVRTINEIIVETINNLKELKLL